MTYRLCRADFRKPRHIPAIHFSLQYSSTTNTINEISISHSNIQMRASDSHSWTLCGHPSTSAFPQFCLYIARLYKHFLHTSRRCNICRPPCYAPHSISKTNSSTNRQYLVLSIIRTDICQYCVVKKQFERISTSGRCKKREK